MAVEEPIVFPIIAETNLPQVVGIAADALADLEREANQTTRALTKAGRGADKAGKEMGKASKFVDDMTDTIVALGPALDGGYYLIGLKRPLPELFVGVPWSTPDVLRVTLEICEKLHLEVVQLARLRDLDTAAGTGFTSDSGSIGRTSSTAVCRLKSNSACCANCDRPSSGRIRRCCGPCSDKRNIGFGTISSRV